MSVEEFNAVRVSTIAAYAAQQVAAGLADVVLAKRRAEAQMDELLPDGVATKGMRLLIAECDSGALIGHVWLGLERPSSPPGTAWLYGIEVVDHERGKGYGRALLSAAEEAARSNGASAMGLNVFASNPVARHIYDSSGYAITAQQMQKPL